MQSRRSIKDPGTWQSEDEISLGTWRSSRKTSQPATSKAVCLPHELTILGNNLSSTAASLFSSLIDTRNGLAWKWNFIFLRFFFLPCRFGAMWGNEPARWCFSSSENKKNFSQIDFDTAIRWMRKKETRVEWLRKDGFGLRELWREVGHNGSPHRALELSINDPISSTQSNQPIIALNCFHIPNLSPKVNQSAISNRVSSKSLLISGFTAPNPTSALLLSLPA